MNLQSNWAFCLENSIWHMFDWRPHITSYAWCPCLFQPLISHQSGFGFFWWSLNIEDPSLNDNSKYEIDGSESGAHENARDRNVKLQWAPLKFMLSIIAGVNKSKEAYGKEHWVDKAEHTSWTLLPGGVIKPAGPIFTWRSCHDRSSYAPKMCVCVALWACRCWFQQQPYNWEVPSNNYHVLN